MGVPVERSVVSALAARRENHVGGQIVAPAKACIDKSNQRMCVQYPYCDRPRNQPASTLTVVEVAAGTRHIVEDLQPYTWHVMMRRERGNKHAYATAFSSRFLRARVLLGKQNSGKGWWCTYAASAFAGQRQLVRTGDVGVAGLGLHVGAGLLLPNAQLVDHVVDDLVEAAARCTTVRSCWRRSFGIASHRNQPMRPLTAGSRRYRPSPPAGQGCPACSPRR